ncbi:unnamed protein product [Rotaria sp. Silwood2]|nr:unnamed protein product [Rotaria sp. Silwood2]
MEDQDPDYQSTFDPSIDEEKLNEQRTALNNFLAACGSKRKVSVTTSYKDLSHRVKLRYVSLTKFIMQSATSLMVSNDADMLMHDSFSDVSSGESNIVLDGNFRQIMSGISEAYSNAESWQSRREILSVVAPKISLKLMQLFIPGITRGRFSAARLHAKKYSAGSKVEVTTKVVQRFDDHQIAHFVDFVISPHVCTDLPFGEKVLKLSSGVELFVPNTIRNMGATRIIEQYLLYCHEMCPDFEPLGKSSLFTILDTCKASTRKSLQGINYFAAEAGEAFDGIRKMIEDKVALHNDSARLIENLKRARFYLKSDYKVHVARSSNIADHCCVYALSDPEKRDFAQDCDHEHNESCAECSNLTITLNEIEQLLEETEKDEELLHRTLKKFRSYREAIEAWKAHLLRSINQDLCRENLLDKLSNDEIYLNLDWAMKFLPIKSREPQSEFFGKRGISWHITVVMKNDASAEDENNIFDEDTDVLDDSQQISEHEMTDLSGENNDDNDVIDKKEKHSFKYKVFVHVFDQCTQDSDTIVAILNDVLCRVKETDPQIKNAFIRSDNAGCYHSANTLVSAKHISEKTGIAIKRIDFGDPQGNKGSSDRFAAVLKSHNGRYMNENHNVTTASELAACSRCYRAELPGGKSEGNLYRVHEFTKVEMFAVTTNDENVSQEMHNDIVRLETLMFEELGLHFRILDMPSEELGPSAYRKYDIETWMPAKEFYGEVSSASNCTDFQSRRLHIKYIDDDGDERFVHTLNGTAMAIPRMLTAIIELNWNPETKQIQIPKPLRSFMGNREFISKSSSTPTTQWIKFLS